MSRLSDEEVLRTSRLMLLGGIPCLPLLWLVHILFHYPLTKEADRSPSLAPTLRRHMTWAAIGVVFWGIALIAWWATFVQLRESLGVTGDTLVVVDIKGT
ncbi:hypothetical protein AMAG_03228 [Allomyces macrogynus ATCC 38327]|uniref:Uncharacterized protein n=1 Tax=Allomyces macrogynus (strain ATCC 38327) TaxID=578462 RepID=A0A0L0S4Z3_ALLM3|nr:hypothetical protein AMAG_03228 [Allomyces macrogynus ATCC 38327]|eukprot:KNE57525.1 hypothetical protein AMAG_03228 [Allomyces macrogynus ATCC 38327]